MSLIRYQPLFGRSRGLAGVPNGWGSLGRLHDDINRLFAGYEATNDEEGTPVADWAPAVDVAEEKDRYVLHADVPGVNPQDIDVSLDDGVLTIRGHRSSETREEDREAGYRRVERVSGQFFRRFSLPETADEKGITAETRNGVLEIVIPKQPKVEPRRIKVKG
ncbi:MAG: Hsp20/alpha crystallin family protein [Gammaproteobacteria bacterium]|nr:Hsp20/alpha crystallin family protein [Gammaproteobacteria bacterium]